MAKLIEEYEVPPAVFQSISPQGDGNLASVSSSSGRITFNPFPRKGTETLKTTSEEEVVDIFQSISPQGDGNIAPNYLDVRKRRNSFNPFPRKGTET